MGVDGLRDIYAIDGLPRLLLPHYNDEDLYLIYLKPEKEDRYIANYAWQDFAGINQQGMEIIHKEKWGVDNLVRVLIHETLHSELYRAIRAGHKLSHQLLDDYHLEGEIHNLDSNVHRTARALVPYWTDIIKDMTTRNMSYLEPTLRAYLQKALDKWNATHDIKVGVSTTFRDAIDQEAAFKAGTSKARFGQSLHNFTPAYAADIYFYVGGKAVWNRPELFKEVRALVPLLEWGGDWKGFVDMPHFQLKMTYQDAAAGRVKPIIETPQPDMKDTIKAIIVKMSLPQFKETVTKLLKLV